MNAAYITATMAFFKEDGSLDLESQGRLFEHLITNGIDGILIGGSSGEFFAMSHEQRVELTRFAVEKIAHRTKLIVGTSHLEASEIVSLSNECLKLGADAVMILPPFYVHFEQDDLFHYYDRLASRIDGPIYLYNFPDNVGSSIAPQTALKLAKAHSNIIGMKDTMAGVNHTVDLIKTVKSEIPSFEIYSGFDNNFAHNVLAGGNGSMGALSNIVPEICCAWVKAFRENDLAGVAKGQKIIDRLMELYFVHSPYHSTIKEACRLRGIASGTYGSFPFPCASAEESAKVRTLLENEGVVLSVNG